MAQPQYLDEQGNEAGQIYLDDNGLEVNQSSNPLEDTIVGYRARKKRKEPDTFWGGFSKSIKDQVLESTVGNPMLQSAAKPKTAGDMLNLLIPASIPNIRRALSKTPKTKVPSIKKPHISAKDFIAMRDAKAKISSMPLDDISNTVERRINQNSLPADVLGDRRHSELLAKFGGRQGLSEPQTLGAIEGLPDSTIPQAVPEVSDISKVEPRIGTLGDEPAKLGQNLAIPETGNINSLPSNEPFNPDTLFSPKKASTLGPRIAQRVSETSNRLRSEGKTVISSDKTGVRWVDEKTGVKGFTEIKWKNDPNWIGKPVAPEVMLKLDKLGIKGEELPSISGPPQVDAPYAPEIRSSPRKPWPDETGSVIVPQSNFTKALAAEIEREGGGLKGAISTTGNTMKSAMSTGDLSAPLRQGAPLIHKKEFRKALPEMVKMFNSDEVYNAAMKEIKDHPTFKFANDMGLNLTGINVGAEERFLSPVLESVPIYGRAVKASDRAYTGFLNKLRFDSFNSLLQDATKAGYKPGRDKALAKEIASFVNDATGRGKLGESGERAASLLNSIFYSPKLFSSRVRMIGRAGEAIVGPLLDRVKFVERVLTPSMYTKQSAFIRKEALKSALSLASFNLTLNGLAATAGAKITYDITNSDFMKSKFGNTRADFGAGFLQPMVFIGRILKNKYTSSVTGKTSELVTGYGQRDPGDLVWQFLTSKEAPLLGLAGDIWTGKDWSGEDKARHEAVVERFIPMISSDLYDIIKDDPYHAGLIIPGILGASIQTYKRPERKLSAH